jgi:hypothetical protein
VTRADLSAITSALRGNPETGLGKSEIAFKQLRRPVEPLENAYQVLDKLQPD